LGPCFVPQTASALETAGPYSQHLISFVTYE